jgi:hypothetical protein
LLENSVAAFHNGPWAKRRRYGRVAFFGLSIAVVGSAALLGAPAFALKAAAFIVTTVLTSFTINSIAARATVLLKVRHFALGAPLWGWALAFALGGTLVGLLWWLGELRDVAENLGLAVAAGLLSYVLLDRRVLRERQPVVEVVEQMLKSMRLRGLEELTLRQFVCRYCGEHWEEFYEALFGFEAKLQARAWWGRDEKGLPRRRYGVWREPLIRWLDRRLERRRERQAQGRLADAEREALDAGAGP